MSDYDYGDDELRDDDDNSSDDENMGFVPAKRRFQYTTFGDEDKVDNHDVDYGKDTATYGVFLNGDGPPRKQPKTSFSRTPTFVKGTAEKTQDEGDDLKTTTTGAQSSTTLESPRASEAPVSVEPEKQDSEDEETARFEKERKEQQEIANARFHQLLGRGRGGRRQRSRADGPSASQEPTTGTGLGFQAGGSSMQHMNEDLEVPTGLGMPSNFGIGLKPPTPIRVDPNLGKWEKHTKGIGMKLLTKMGYGGSGGLGAKRLKKKDSREYKEEKRVGISRPVEVKVRPANLGLGFGSFKEATNLKANKQIEAEVRGVEPSKQKELEESDDMGFRKSDSSALPTTQELLQQQSWKKGARQSSKKRPRRTVVPYTELLKTQKQSIIIDMRGPAVDQANEADKEVPLAEELLHNVTILMNTYENKIHSASHFVESNGKKLQSLRSDVSDMEQQLENVDDRITKMRNVQRIIDEIEELLGGDDHSVDSAKALVRQLGESLSADERAALRFDDVLAPSLLSPMIRARMDAWDPLQDDLSATETMLVSAMRFADDDGESNLLMKRVVFFDHIVARAKIALESTKWDPMSNVENAVRLVEAVLASAIRTFPPRTQTAAQQEEENVFVLPADTMDENHMDVADRVKRELVFDTVVSKLSRAVSQWEPVLSDDSETVENRLDLWILPWIQYLDHPTVLPQMANDCRRKLRSALSYLQRKLVDDESYFRSSIGLLKPWIGLLEQKTIQELASKYISTRMARFLSRQNVSRATKGQGWDGLDTLFRCHGTGVMADREFLSLVEGSVLSMWLGVVHDWLSTAHELDVDAFSDFYGAWKEKLLKGPKGTSGDMSRSSILLRGDSAICRMFYSGLFLLRSTQSSGSIVDYLPSSTSFPVVFARRSMEANQRIEEELRRMEHTTTNSNGPSVRRPPASNGGATFRDLVEDFARERNVSFVPKMGANSTKDGKQVFMFGRIAIYLDSDVVFMLNESKWRPISLEELVEKAEM